MSRRVTIGIIGWVLLIVGIFIFFYGPHDDTWTMLCGACVRVGLIMLALWLAFPQVSRVPPWIYGCSLVALIVVAARPKWIVWVGPSLVALWLVRPRPGKKDGDKHKRPASNRS